MDHSRTVRRAERVWRVLFVIYAIALTTGTHWPALEVGSATAPAPDKLIHAIAFGGLGALLALTGWVGSIAALAAILVAWAVIDEVTQGLPVLERDISWYDLAASLLGVCILVAWRWALRPIGGAGNRARLSFMRLATATVFASGRGWIALSGGAVLGIVLLGPGIGAFAWALGFTMFEATLLAAATGSLAGAHWSLVALLRRTLRTLAPRRPCLSCERSLADAAPGEDGFVRCEGCGAAQWPGQWRREPGLPRVAVIRLMTRPALIAISIVLGLLCAAVLLVVLHTTVPTIGAANRAYFGLPADLRLSVDLALVALLAAWATGNFRRSLARRIDEQDRRCLGCDHDLTATPTESGAGRCGECGVGFLVPPR